MSTFLLEIGTEELPASFVRHALAALPEIARDLLSSARLEHGAIRTMGTPRRLSLMVFDLATRQSDLSEQVVGPPKAVALGPDGQPTKAGIGFAKKQGLGPEALLVVATDKGEYVAVQREEAGRPAGDVLPTLVPDLCERIAFPKSMRWGEGDVSFGRPIHWIVCLQGSDVIRFSFAGVQAGCLTRGHRFLHPGTVEIDRAENYIERLEAAHVIVDIEERQRRMEAALHDQASSLGYEVVPDAFLVSECVSLVEEPYVVPGSFDSSFLALPEAVIVSVLRDHQRYFALRAPSGGKLAPRYLNVVNTARDPETITQGNDRVLRARLADAQFFVDEDKKIPLEERVPRLDKVVFQNKLGSIGEKVRRIAALAPTLVDRALRTTVERAAHLSKADLETLIVGEFPELQGEMGRFYASREDISDDVATAIADHYLPRGAHDAVPSHAVGASVAVADRLDTLAGCFGIGLAPTGSADPFALRRAALGIIRIALEGPIDVQLRAAVELAFGGYRDQKKDLDTNPNKLLEFFRSRLRALYAQNFATDLVDACLAAWPDGSLRDLDMRIRALSTFKNRPEYDSVAIAFKRAFNIASDAPAEEWLTDRLVEDAERTLASRFVEVRPRLDAAAAAGDYESALTMIASELREPIDRFFDSVMVMVEDDTLRENRLRLLGRIADAVKKIAHLELLST